jgi:hypothetical protein
MYMTPAAADLQLSRSLGVRTGAVNKLEGVEAPLSAVAMRPVSGAGQPVSVDTPNPTALRAAMASQGMVGPGVSPSAANLLIRGSSTPPVDITATRPGSGSGKGKGAPVTTTARFNPQTPLLRPGSRIPTAAGVRAAVAPTLFGGMPTGPKGSGFGRAPMYAALAGMTIPQLFNLYNYGFNAPEDPTGGPLSGLVPRVGYNPAVLGAEPGFFSDTPTIYENVVGRDVPVQ